MRTLMFLLFTTLSLSLLACSDDEGASKTSPLEGIWVDERVQRSYDAHQRGRSPQEVCSHIDPDHVDTIMLTERGVVYDCPWSPDWRSHCEATGTLDGHTITSEMDNTRIIMTIEMIDNQTMRPSEVMINGEPYRAEDVMERVSVQKRVSETKIAKMNEIITVTCR